MTIPELLQQLSDIAPETCRREDYSEGPHYAIGDYIFWLNTFGEFEASYKATVCRGGAALAWLQDAIQRECEARGFYWIQECKEAGSSYYAQVGAKWNILDSPAHALLAAFVAAVEANRR